MNKIKVGSDFSGVGAFDQALRRLKIDYQTEFSCDMDKYARQSYIANYGEPKYYPENVYNREIPEKSLDIYMTSPPCQAFSLAGKRKGEGDDRGILFYNSHEFIRKNKPRYFIFENVKGLLSDDSGRTFQKWVDYLGGKSVNGLPVLFPHEDAVDYHIYYKVLNTKNYGVPQNRERIFIVGIRDDADNQFTWPKEMHLQMKLKDVLEDEVDPKYFLSDKMIKVLQHHGNPIINKETPDKSACIHAGYFKMGGRDQQYLKVKSATKKGYEEAINGDSINFSVSNSQTRRGRVGKGVAQTLDTQCNQAVVEEDDDKKWIQGGLQSMQKPKSDGISPCLTSAMGMGGGHTPFHNYEGKIRRLTPRECFRLQDFPDSFKFVVSDTQLYKQAGNSITVAVLAAIINKLKL
jgi:DNA (cytosine-5)-methyltransferase 1